MIRSYKDYIHDILSEIETIEIFNSSMDFESFKHDKKTVYATIRSLEIIGEASKMIPTDLRLDYPDIPWVEIRNMRNKLTHEYFGVDIDTVWATIKNDLIELKKVLKTILEDKRSLLK
jgi:uncharacterized protein with HEPN domain